LVVANKALQNSYQLLESNYVLAIAPKSSKSIISTAGLVGDSAKESLY
jgi:hypothetical protein